MTNLRWKCYDREGVYQAAARDVTIAGAIMAILGKGATVKDGYNKRRVVYREGRDGDCEGMNGGGYDDVAVHLERKGYEF